MIDWLIAIISTIFEWRMLLPYESWRIIYGMWFFVLLLALFVGVPVWVVVSIRRFFRSR